MRKHAHCHLASNSPWTKRCSEILSRNAARFTNVEVAALIEAETGLRFSAYAVSRQRAARDLPSPPRNNWTAPIARWRRNAAINRHTGVNPHASKR